MRRRTLAVLIGAVAMLLAALPTALASAAPSPWWQIVTGSRPTNLWVPESEVQEIDAPATPFFLEVEGEIAGIFNFPPFFPESTAENVQTALEGAYGAGNVEVTGGPGGVAPLIVTSIGEDAGRNVAPIGIAPSGSTRIVKAGGSGRLVVTLTNLGDAPLDATSTPLTITDELPEGVEATGFEAIGGVQNKAGQVDCEVKASDELSCSFEDVLPSYDSIEIEIFASLTGEPPVAGAPGKVTVSGGDGPTASALQSIEVSPEEAPFGLERFSAQAEEEGGIPSSQAGRHPFQLTTTVQFNSGPMTPAATRRESSIEQPAQPRNLRFPLPAGLVGNATTAPVCSLSDFYAKGPLIDPSINRCPAESAIGAVSLLIVEKISLGFARLAVPVFNLPPAHGEPARFGFTVANVRVVIDTEVDPDDEYRIIASVNNASQLAEIPSTTLTIWGAPGDPSHDSARGWACVYHAADLTPDLGPCERPSGLGEDAFLRQPVSCVTPLDFRAEIEPWNTPIGSVVDKKTVGGGTLSGCNQVPFDPHVVSSPTSKLAANPSGFDFRLDMPNTGLLDPNARAEGQAKKVEVALPAGMSVNPSAGEGLVGCSPADLARETASSHPGEGCPEASKVGELQISTPLLKEEAHGSLYIASPHDNPFNSLIALYAVAKIPERGILIKQAGKVEADPQTGQLVTTFDDLPQVPFTSFKLHFREGGRAPLVTPPSCDGDPSEPGNQPFAVTAKFTPWSAANPDNPAPNEVVTRTSQFTVERGVDGGACPSGGLPPFHPGLNAGTINNAAGTYSPFNLRLTRKDGEQEFTHFSIKLPPGVTGKLAGIPFCSDAAIAAAKARTGANGGLEELEHPSCPAASEVGRTLVGAGVGATLTYVPGKVYLASPYNGSALSIVSITPARVGPFDLGTVVVREALKINPDTAEVFVDAAGSDPIPHIIQGIPVHARDIRVYVDRPEFALNPTSCKRTSTASTVLGSGLDFGSASDDQPVTVTSPFQAASCASLGFKPKLALSLKGGTKRGDTPRLKAVLTARKGDANVGAAQVTLPHSEFLEQAHIKTICTRVQFAAGGGNGEQCPPASIYGRAKAVTPLLDEPLVGPVYLRSSSHELPDLVAALHSGKVDINLDGRIDSIKNGRIRNSFEAVPDAPVTKFTLEMQGGKKGLLVNSTNLCKRKHWAIAAFTGQNGKRHDFNPLLKVRCGGKSGKHKGKEPPKRHRAG
jgi:hypothetical protein